MRPWCVSAAGPELLARVDFAGAPSGWLTLRAGFDLARSLAADFLGEDEESIGRLTGDGCLRRACQHCLRRRIDANGELLHIPPLVAARVSLPRKALALLKTRPQNRPF